MAKYKIGDKVICKSHPEYGVGKIMADYCDDSYVVRFPAVSIILYSKELNTSDEFKLGDVVINILNPQWGTGIICEVISPKTYIVMFQNSFTSVQLECNADELQSFSEAAGNAFKNITSKINRMENNKMPDITNYSYNETTAVTTIEWSDGTKTVARAEDLSTASQYTGFVTAYAKKAAGNNNTINKLYDEWAVKKPAREIKEQIKVNAAELEKQHIAEKHKAKKEQYLIRKRAAEINKEYEAKKLAHEKYGVPMDFKAGDSD